MTVLSFRAKESLMGKVLAVCISEVRGIQKHPVAEAELRIDHGIVGDAHTGSWHRQISILGIDSVNRLREKVSIDLKAGDFAENILAEGLTVHELPVGTKLHLGTALVEVTQIRKECHADCAIRQQAGDCVMPREGIFARVLKDGAVSPGDDIIVANTL